MDPDPALILSRLSCLNIEIDVKTDLHAIGTFMFKVHNKTINIYFFRLRMFFYPAAAENN